MSSEPPQTTEPVVNTTEQRIKRAQKRPNKSQMRAAKTRREHAAAAPVVHPTVVAPSTTVQSQSLTPAQRRALERGLVARGSGLPVGVAPLTREEEMKMVREDMTRLLIIAGILLAGMLSLLFVIH